MKMNWFLLSIISMLGFTVMMLLVKYIMNSGVSSEVVIFYQFLITIIFLLPIIFYQKIPLKLSTNIILLFLLVGLISVIANFALFKSISLSKNPGFPLAVMGVHVILVTIISFFLFKIEFDFIKILGTILAVIGVILIGLK